MKKGERQQPRSLEMVFAELIAMIELAKQFAGFRIKDHIERQIREGQAAMADVEDAKGAEKAKAAFADATTSIRCMLTAFLRGAEAYFTEKLEVFRSALDASSRGSETTTDEDLVCYVEKRIRNFAEAFRLLGATTDLAKLSVPYEEVVTAFEFVRVEHEKRRERRREAMQEILAARRAAVEAERRARAEVARAAQMVRAREQRALVASSMADQLSKLGFGGL
jgi:hypothetical protein